MRAPKPSCDLQAVTRAEQPPSEPLSPQAPGQLFLEKRAYRLRRLMDAVFLLPVFAFVLFAGPAWMQSGQQLPAAWWWGYFFCVWMGLLLVCCAFSVILRSHDAGKTHTAERAASPQSSASKPGSESDGQG